MVFHLHVVFSWWYCSLYLDSGVLLCGLGKWLGRFSAVVVKEGGQWRLQGGTFAFTEMSLNVALETTFVFCAVISVCYWFEISNVLIHVKLETTHSFCIHIVMKKWMAGYKLKLSYVCVYGDVSRDVVWRRGFKYQGGLELFSFQLL